MAIKAIIGVKIDGKELPPPYQQTLQSVEVELGVYKQGMVHLRFSIGQDPTGDFAGWAEDTFTPLKPVQVDANIGGNTQRLINAVLTGFKMNLKADPCESQLELTAMDALELVKRSTDRRSYPNHSLKAVVSTVLQRQQIEEPRSGVPERGAENPNRDVLMQSQNDLELLRKLADQNHCDVYVEPDGDKHQGHFEPLDLDNAAEITPTLVANAGTESHIRSASFYYDLSGPTAYEAEFVDRNGKHGSKITVDLRDSPLLSAKDKTVLGPKNYSNPVKLERHGLEDREKLRQRCEAELDKHSWLVVGKGEIDSSRYGAALLPRRRVQVKGVSSSFSGPFMVWDVTHSFTRELYCQRFELRRKLGVK